MPIIHYPGYITREEAALRKKVQLRAINDQVKRKAIEHVRLDGWVFIKDNLPGTLTPPPNISLAGLKWLPHVARKHKFIADRLYEEVIVGKVTAVVVVDRVFVIEDEPALMQFLKTVKQKNPNSKYMLRKQRMLLSRRV